MGRTSISIKGSLKGLSPSSTDAPQPAPLDEDDPPQESGSGSAEVDPERIHGAWQDYASGIEKSKPRVFSTLKSNTPRVGADGVVEVFLNSEAQRDNFMKNIRSELTRFIIEKTGIQAIDIQARVVKQEQNGKRIYTEQDKLNYLIEKNPELGHLKTRFNLDFDN
jgi:DNA polymerase-3 subunit gamma/tau